jgi:hypothetical protein
VVVKEIEVVSVVAWADARAVSTCGLPVEMGSRNGELVGSTGLTWCVVEVKGKAVVVLSSTVVVENAVVVVTIVVVLVAVVVVVMMVVVMVVVAIVVVVEGTVVVSCALVSGASTHSQSRQPAAFINQFGTAPALQRQS